MENSVEDLLNQSKDQRWSSKFGGRKKIQEEKENNLDRVMKLLKE